MVKIQTNKPRFWILLAVAVGAVAFFGYKYWLTRRDALPDGIAWGNGRVEAKLMDVSAKETLRVKDLLVDEGDLVKPGQVLGHLDTVTLNAELAQAEAGVIAAEQQVAVANAAIARRKSEIELAKIETERSKKLVEANAGSQREYDVRRSQLATTTAALAEEEGRLESAKKEIEVAQADVVTMQTRIDDAILTAPVTGRVLYRLTEPGEVLSPGGKAMTLVNLEDVYMEIYLPAEQAAAISIGADARITFDYAPGQAVPGKVTFVSPEAQFTPKEVETRSEREKLMFRVKIQIPPELVFSYIERIKTGVRGIGYVKVKESAEWPASLQKLLTPLPASESKPG